MKFYLCIGLAVMMIGGCSSPNFQGRPDLVSVQNADLPPPDPMSATVAARPALLGPGDKLSVEVFGIADLSRQVTVDSGGSIALPLVGTVQAVGKSPQDLGAEIQTRLSSNFVRDPRVTVSVVEVQSQVLAIEGEVGEPGLYPLTGSTTLMRAIALGGGTGEFARTNHVIIFRRVNGQDMAALHDLRAIQLGVYPDPAVYAGDIVVVSEDRARRMFGTFIQSAGILAGPLVTILQR